MTFSIQQPLEIIFILIFLSNWNYIFCMYVFSFVINPLPVLVFGLQIVLANNFTGLIFSIFHVLIVSNQILTFVPLITDLIECLLRLHQQVIFTI